MELTSVRWRPVGIEMVLIVLRVVSAVVGCVLATPVCVQRQEHTQRNYLSSKQSTRMLHLTSNISCLVEDGLISRWQIGVGKYQVCLKQVID